MNKVTLVGRLGQDPEHQTATSGNTFVKFSIATNDGYGDNKKTNWHSCTAFGKSADIINQYVKKGNEIAVSGAIYYNEHNDKRYTNILVDSFTFIGGKSEATDKMQDAKKVIDDKFAPKDDDSLPF